MLLAAAVRCEVENVFLVEPRLGQVGVVGERFVAKRGTDRPRFARRSGNRGAADPRDALVDAVLVAGLSRVRE